MVAKRKLKSVKPSVAGHEPGIHVPTRNGDILITRRQLLYGAIGIGALAAVGGGASALSKVLDQKDTDATTSLSVPASSIITLDNLTKVAAEDYVSLIGQYELPYGTLLWANNDTLAACLLPTETPSPLTQIALLNLKTGYYSPVRIAAVGQSEGFDMYDARVSEKGLIWTEANILADTWRIYTATYNNGSLGTPIKVDEGGGDWETPTIAAIGGYAFWQVLPTLTGSKKTELSVLRRAPFGSDQTTVAYTSSGRMCTPLYPLSESLVITPRTNSSSTQYQMTHINAGSLEVSDRLALPAAMKPLEAGWGNNGFTFSFDAIYSFGNGISNLGTYTPQNPISEHNHTNTSWFRFGRSPSAPPAWCNDFFIVKSTKVVCGMDFANKTYFVIDALDGSDTFGDYLASTGTNETIVTFSNIDYKPLDGEAKKNCTVRVWAAISSTS